MKFSTRWICQISLALIWVYQGVIPKIIFQHRDELEMIMASGVFVGYEKNLVIISGILEILFGICFVVFSQKNIFHVLNIVGLIGLLLAAIVSKPEILTAAFNPPSLTIAMVSLSIIALSQEIPN